MYTMILIYSFIAILLLPTSEQVTAALGKHLEKMELSVDNVCILAKIPDAWDLDNMFQLCNIDIQPQLKSTLLHQNNPPEKIISHFCRMTPCGEIVINRLNPCLNDTQKNYLRNLSAFEKAQLDYVCSDDGTVIKIMNNVDYSDCTGIFIGLQNCISENNPSMINSLERFTNKRNCRKQLELEDCLAEQYKSCISKIPHYFVKNVAFYGYNATSCNKYMSGRSPVDLTKPIPEEIVQQPENLTSPLTPSPTKGVNGLSSSSLFVLVMILLCIQVDNILF